MYLKIKHLYFEIRIYIIKSEKKKKTKNYLIEVMM